MSTKQRIKDGIILYFSFLKDGQEFNGIDLVRHCLSYAGCPDKYPDTVFRYMREMREKKVLDFECISNPKSLYKKLYSAKVDKSGQTSLL